MAIPVETADEVRGVLALINDAWRGGHPETMGAHLCLDIVMVFPDFSGRMEGRDAMIESFRAFAREAKVLEYRPGDVVVDGDTSAAIAQYPFEMVYERDGARWRSTGWDVWMFSRTDGGWRAAWRTMQAIAEVPA